MELSFWESISDSDNTKTFEAYLEQYPDGLFAGVARVRIEELTQQAGAAEWQSASNIQEVLNGIEISGIEEGTYWKESYEPDGTIKGLWGAEEYEGKWSFKGDLMCVDYEGTEDDGCWYLAIRGDKVFLWKEDGTPDGDFKVLRK